MKFHWVSQNQTGDEEVSGGYMWCPITNKDGSRSPYYDMMRDVQPGDVVFSYRNKLITHIGIVISKAYLAQKPAAFVSMGTSWLDTGWKVIVEYQKTPTPFSPKDHFHQLKGLLPGVYSPLNVDGNGAQMYFTTLNSGLAQMLLTYSGFTLPDLQRFVAILEPMILNSDGYIQRDATSLQLQDDDRIEKLNIPNTSKLALTAARVGQGMFRDGVLTVEQRCRVTKINDPHFLKASHIKPWRVGTDEERLDKYNGLMLTPTIDHLFDQGYISFTDDGRVLRMPDVADQVWNSLGISVDPLFSVGQFHQQQRRYLEYHRDLIRKTRW